MKKKIAALVLVIALAATAVIGGTLAYFTDTDEATNTFTAGNVKIEMNEYDNAGQEFVQKQTLLPGSSTENAIAKNVVVTVKQGSADSYVWVEMLIPTELYVGEDENHEHHNALHYNQFLNYLQGYEEGSTNPNAVECAKTYTDSDHQWSVMKYIDEVTVDGTIYARLRTTHANTVKANETTSPAVNQFYMDSTVYAAEEEGTYMIPADWEAKEFVEYNGSWEVIINAYAIQADGFDSVDEAVEAYTAQAK